MIKKIIAVSSFSIISQFVLADAPVVDYSSDHGSNGRDNSKQFILRSEPEAAIHTNDLSVDQRINRLEQQISNINQQNIANKIDELQQRVQSLNGQLEEQAHQIEQFNIQLRNFYQDLNKRLDTPPEKRKPIELPSSVANLSEAAINPLEASNKEPTTVSTPPISGEILEVFPGSKESDKSKENDSPKSNATKSFLKEQQAYQTALDLLPDKKYEESGNKLRNYIKIYPKGVYVANAHYWLGEINLLQRNYDAAEEEFKMVVAKYSKSKRVPDAMFKLALVHQNQGRDSQSKNELRQIIKKYPGTSAAQLAKAQLDGNQ